MKGWLLQMATMAFMVYGVMGWSAEREEIKSEPRDFEELTVTATRSEKESFYVSQEISSMNEKQFRIERSPRTLVEALKEDPAVLVQKTAHGQGSPFIRGFTAFRNLFLIDGIRLNNSVFRSGPNQYWATVDSLMLEKMELVKGPSSVLYGSDSVGGTLQVMTREMGYSDVKRRIETRLYGRAASAEESLLGRIDVAGDIKQGMAFSLGLTRRDYGDLKAGNPTGDQPATGYDELSFDGKMEWHIDENRKWIIAHQNLQQQDAWRTHKTIFGVSFEGSTVGSELKRALDQKRRLSYIQFKQKNNDSWYDAMQASLSLHEQDEMQDRIRNRGSTRRQDVQGFEVDTLGFDLQFEKETSSGRWTFGGEYYQDDVDSFKREWDLFTNAQRGPFIQGPIADDSDYDLYGLFVQNELPLSEKWLMTTGLRWQATDLNAGAVEDPVSGNQISLSDDSSTFLGSLHFSFFPSEAWHIYSGVSQSFRAPNLSDLTRLDTARTNEIETPVPGGLDPEKFVTYDIGFKFSQSKVDMGLGWYYTDISDMIIRTPTGRTIGTDLEVTKKNSGNGFVSGVEFDFRYHINPAYSISVQSAWMDGEIDTFPTSTSLIQSDHISRMLPWTSILGLRYKSTQSRWWWEVLWTTAQKQDKLSLRDQGDTQRIPPGGTPGYNVITLRNGWRVNDHLDLSATLENIGNEDYRIHGSGLNEAGFNAIFAMQTRF